MIVLLSANVNAISTFYEKSAIVALPSCNLINEDNNLPNNLDKEDAINVFFGDNTPSTPTVEKKWTLMLYCGGDEFNPRPVYDEILDVLLNKFDYKIDTSVINIVCLYDYGASGCFFGHVIKKDNGKSGLEIVEEYDELNMGDYSTLKSFLDRCKNEYPAERYFLQMIGHATGYLGANYDEYTISSSEDTPYMLSMREIKDSIYNSLGKVDILAQTGCLMGMIECAYEFRDITDVYIASEDLYLEPLVPLTVIEDFKILQSYSDESNYDISKRIVTKLKDFSISPDFTLSAVRTDKLHRVFDLVNSLSNFLIQNMDEYGEAIEESFLNCKHYALSFSGFVDIIDFVDHISSNIASSAYNKEILDIIKYLKLAVEEAVFIEEHNFNNKNSHGLSIGFLIYEHIGLEFYRSKWDEFVIKFFEEYDCEDNNGISDMANAASGDSNQGLYQPMNPVSIRCSNI
jgi:hypothetical protein